MRAAYWRHKIYCLCLMGVVLKLANNLNWIAFVLGFRKSKSSLTIDFTACNRKQHYRLHGNKAIKKGLHNLSVMATKNVESFNMYSLYWYLVKGLKTGFIMRSSWCAKYNCNNNPLFSHQALKRTRTTAMATEYH